MSKTLAVSHVFVISENMDIVDLGEYSGHLLHVEPALEQPIFYPDDMVLNRLKLSFKPTLHINHPSTNTEQIFVSSDEKVPITDIFSCSNENGDCIIMGTIKETVASPIAGNTVIIIDPYNYKTVTGRMHKEADVLNELAEKGGRYCEEAPTIIQRINPIVERMKQVKL